MKPNVEIIGSPTIVDGVVSNLSMNNYVTIPDFPSGVTNFEIMLKVNFKQFGVWQHFFTTSYLYSVTISCSNAGVLRLYLSSNGTSWDLSNGNGKTQLTAGVTYYIKLTFDGSTYRLFVSPDKTDWKEEVTVSSTKSVASNNSYGCMGKGWTKEPASYTSFDLNESYIKIDGQTWWEGVTREKILGLYALKTKDSFYSLRRRLDVVNYECYSNNNNYLYLRTPWTIGDNAYSTVDKTKATSTEDLTINTNYIIPSNFNNINDPYILIKNISENVDQSWKRDSEGDLTKSSNDSSYLLCKEKN